MDAMMGPCYPPRFDGAPISYHRYDWSLSFVIHKLSLRYCERSLLFALHSDRQSWKKRCCNIAHNILPFSSIRMSPSYFRNYTSNTMLSASVSLTLTCRRNCIRCFTTSRDYVDTRHYDLSSSSMRSVVNRQRRSSHSAGSRQPPGYKSIKKKK